MLQVEAILKHLLTTLGTMFRRVAIAFTSVLLGGIVVVEGVAAGLTREFPPSGLTHVVAVIVGFSLALNIALVIAIEEGLRGFIHLIGDVAKVTEKAVEKVGAEVVKDGGALIRAAEHEASQLAQGAGSVLTNVEHGAGSLLHGAERGVVTAVKDVAHVPGQIIGGIEGGVQGIERHLGGGDRQP